MRKALLILLGLAIGGAASAQLSRDPPPLLPVEQGGAIAEEVSGSAALRTIHALSLHHRMRGSAGFNAAAETIRDRLREIGLAEVEIIALPADGEIFYGTQRSRPAWNATFAELWEQRQEAGRWRDAVRVASWADQPIGLAQDSAGGRAEAALVDIGAGTSPEDYAGKDVRGRLVLTASQPEGFGYSWLDDQLQRAGLSRPRLLDREPEWPGPSFGYETLNLVDGRRSVGEIRDVLAGTVGPAPVEEVTEYLDTLARLGVLEPVRR